MVFLLKKAATAALIAAGLTIGTISYFAQESQRARMQGVGGGNNYFDMNTNSNNENMGNPSRNRNFFSSTRNRTPCNCQVITKCPNLNSGQGIRGRFCGFEGFQRKVCCDGDDSTPLTPLQIQEAQAQADLAKFYRNPDLYKNEGLNVDNSGHREVSTFPEKYDPRLPISPMDVLSYEFSTQRSSVPTERTDEFTTESPTMSTEELPTSKNNPSGGDDLSKSSTTIKPVENQPKLLTIEDLFPDYYSTGSEENDRNSNAKSFDVGQAQGQAPDVELSNVDEASLLILAQYFPDYYEELLNNLKHTENITEDLLKNKEIITTSRPLSESLGIDSGGVINNNNNNKTKAQVSNTGLDEIGSTVPSLKDEKEKDADRVRSTSASSVDMELDSSTIQSTGGNEASIFSTIASKISEFIGTTISPGSSDLNVISNDTTTLPASHSETPTTTTTSETELAVSRAGRLDLEMSTLIPSANTEAPLSVSSGLEASSTQRPGDDGVTTTEVLQVNGTIADTEMSMVVEALGSDKSVSEVEMTTLIPENLIVTTILPESSSHVDKTEENDTTTIRQGISSLKDLGVESTTLSASSSPSEEPLKATMGSVSKESDAFDRESTTLSASSTVFPLSNVGEIDKTTITPEKLNIDTTTGNVETSTLPVVRSESLDYTLSSIHNDDVSSFPSKQVDNNSVSAKNTIMTTESTILEKMGVNEESTTLPASKSSGSSKQTVEERDTTTTKSLDLGSFSTESGKLPVSTSTEVSTSPVSKDEMNNIPLTTINPTAQNLETSSKDSTTLPASITQSPLNSSEDVITSTTKSDLETTTLLSQKSEGNGNVVMTTDPDTFELKLADVVSTTLPASRTEIPGTSPGSKLEESEATTLQTEGIAAINMESSTMSSLRLEKEGSSESETKSTEKSTGLSKEQIITTTNQPDELKEEKILIESAKLPASSTETSSIFSTIASKVSEFIGTTISPDTSDQSLISNDKTTLSASNINLEVATSTETTEKSKSEDKISTTNDSFKLNLDSSSTESATLSVTSSESPTTRAESSPENPTTTASGPEIPTTTAANPDVSTTAASNPDVSTTAASNPEIPKTTATGPKIPTTTASNFEIPTTTESIPDVPTTTASNPEIPTTTASSPENPTTTASGPEIPTTTASSPDVPTTTASIPDAPTTTAAPQTDASMNRAGRIDLEMSTESPTTIPSSSSESSTSGSTNTLPASSTETSGTQSPISATLEPDVSTSAQRAPSTTPKVEETTISVSIIDGPDMTSRPFETSNLLRDETSSSSVPPETLPTSTETVRTTTVNTQETTLPVKEDSVSTSPASLDVLKAFTETTTLAINNLVESVTESIATTFGYKDASTTLPEQSTIKTEESKSETTTQFAQLNSPSSENPSLIIFTTEGLDFGAPSPKIRMTSESFKEVTDTPFSTLNTLIDASETPNPTSTPEVIPQRIDFTTISSVEKDETTISNPGSEIDQNINAGDRSDSRPEVTDEPSASTMNAILETTTIGISGSGTILNSQDERARLNTIDNVKTTMEPNAGSVDSTESVFKSDLPTGSTTELDLTTLNSLPEFVEMTGSSTVKASTLEAEVSTQRMESTSSKPEESDRSTILPNAESDVITTSGIKSDFSTGRTTEASITTVNSLSENAETSNPSTIASTTLDTEVTTQRSDSPTVSTVENGRTSTELNAESDITTIAAIKSDFSIGSTIEPSVITLNSLSDAAETFSPSTKTSTVDAEVTTQRSESLVLSTPEENERTTLPNAEKESTTISVSKIDSSTGSTTETSVTTINSLSDARQASSPSTIKATTLESMTSTQRIDSTTTKSEESERTTIIQPNAESDSTSTASPNSDLTIGTTEATNPTSNSLPDVSETSNPSTGKDTTLEPMTSTQRSDLSTPKPEENESSTIVSNTESDITTDSKFSSDSSITTTDPYKLTSNSVIDDLETSSPISTSTPKSTTLEPVTSSQRIDSPTILPSENEATTTSTSVDLVKTTLSSAPDDISAIRTTQEPSVLDLIQGNSTTETPSTVTSMPIKDEATSTSSQDSITTTTSSTMSEISRDNSAEDATTTLPLGDVNPTVTPTSDSGIDSSSVTTTIRSIIEDGITTVKTVINSFLGNTEQPEGKSDNVETTTWKEVNIPTTTSDKFGTEMSTVLSKASDADLMDLSTTTADSALKNNVDSTTSSGTMEILEELQVSTTENPIGIIEEVTTQRMAQVTTSGSGSLNKIKDQTFTQEETTLTPVELTSTPENFNDVTSNASGDAEMKSTTVIPSLVEMPSENTESGGSGRSIDLPSSGNFEITTTTEKFMEIDISTAKKSDTSESIVESTTTLSTTATGVKRFRGSADDLAETTTNQGIFEASTIKSMTSSDIQTTTEVKGDTMSTTSMSDKPIDDKANPEDNVLSTTTEINPVILLESDTTVTPSTLNDPSISTTTVNPNFSKIETTTQASTVETTTLSENPKISEASTLTPLEINIEAETSTTTASTTINPETERPTDPTKILDKEYLENSLQAEMNETRADAETPVKMDDALSKSIEASLDGMTTTMRSPSEPTTEKIFHKEVGTTTTLMPSTTTQGAGTTLTPTTAESIVEDFTEKAEAFPQSLNVDFENATLNEISMEKEQNKEFVLNITEVFTNKTKEVIGALRVNYSNVASESDEYSGENDIFEEAVTDGGFDPEVTSSTLDPISFINNYFHSERTTVLPTEKPEVTTTDGTTVDGGFSEKSEKATTSQPLVSLDQETTTLKQDLISQTTSENVLARMEESASMSTTMDSASIEKSTTLGSVSYAEITTTIPIKSKATESIVNVDETTTSKLELKSSTPQSDLEVTTLEASSLKTGLDDSTSTLLPATERSTLMGMTNNEVPMVTDPALDQRFVEITTESESALEKDSNTVKSPTNLEMESTTNKLSGLSLGLEGDSTTMKSAQSISEEKSTTVKSQKSLLEEDSTTIKTLSSEAETTTNKLSSLILEGDSTTMNSVQSISEEKSTTVKSQKSLLEEDSTTIKTLSSEAETTTNKLSSLILEGDSTTMNSVQSISEQKTTAAKTQNFTPEIDSTTVKPPESALEIETTTNKLSSLTSEKDATTKSSILSSGEDFTTTDSSFQVDKPESRNFVINENKPNTVASEESTTERVIISQTTLNSLTSEDSKISTTIGQLPSENSNPTEPSPLNILYNNIQNAGEEIISTTLSSKIESPTDASLMEDSTLSNKIISTSTTLSNSEEKTTPPVIDENTMQPSSLRTFSSAEEITTIKSKTSTSKESNATTTEISIMPETTTESTSSQELLSEGQTTSNSKTESSSAPESDTGLSSTLSTIPEINTLPSSEGTTITPESKRTDRIDIFVTQRIEESTVGIANEEITSTFSSVSENENRMEVMKLDKLEEATSTMLPSSDTTIPTIVSNKDNSTSNEALTLLGTQDQDEDTTTMSNIKTEGTTTIPVIGILNLEQNETFTSTPGHVNGKSHTDKPIKVETTTENYQTSSESNVDVAQDFSTKMPQIDSTTIFNFEDKSMPSEGSSLKISDSTTSSVPNDLINSEGFSTEQSANRRNFESEDLITSVCDGNMFNCPKTLSEGNMNTSFNSREESNGTEPTTTDSQNILNADSTTTISPNSIQDFDTISNSTEKPSSERGTKAYNLILEIDNSPTPTSIPTLGVTEVPQSILNPNDDISTNIPISQKTTLKSTTDASNFEFTTKMKLVSVKSDNLIETLQEFFDEMEATTVSQGNAKNGFAPTGATTPNTLKIEEISTTQSQNASDIDAETTTTTRAASDLLEVTSPEGSTEILTSTLQSVVISDEIDIPDWVTTSNPSLTSTQASSATEEVITSISRVISKPKVIAENNTESTTPGGRGRTSTEITHSVRKEPESDKTVIELVKELSKVKTKITQSVHKEQNLMLSMTTELPVSTTDVLMEIPQESTTEGTYDSFEGNEATTMKSLDDSGIMSLTRDNQLISDELTGKTINVKNGTELLSIDETTSNAKVNLTYGEVDTGNETSLGVTDSSLKFDEGMDMREMEHGGETVNRSKDGQDNNMTETTTSVPKMSSINEAFGIQDTTESRMDTFENNTTLDIEIPTWPTIVENSEILVESDPTQISKLEEKEFAENFTEFLKTLTSGNNTTENIVNTFVETSTLNFEDGLESYESTPMNDYTFTEVSQSSLENSSSQIALIENTTEGILNSTILPDISNDSNFTTENSLDTFDINSYNDSETFGITTQNSKFTSENTTFIPEDIVDFNTEIPSSTSGSIFPENNSKSNQIIVQTTENISSSEKPISVEIEGRISETTTENSLNLEFETTSVKSLANEFTIENNTDVLQYEVDTTASGILDSTTIKTLDLIQFTSEDITLPTLTSLNISTLSPESLETSETTTMHSEKSEPTSPTGSSLSGENTLTHIDVANDPETTTVNPTSTTGSPLTLETTLTPIETSNASSVSNSSEVQSPNSTELDRIPTSESQSQPNNTNLLNLFNDLFASLGPSSTQNNTLESGNNDTRPHHHHAHHHARTNDRKLILEVSGPDVNDTGSIRKGKPFDPRLSDLTTTSTPIPPQLLVSVKIGPGPGPTPEARALFPHEADLIERQLQNQISNVVNQLLLTTHENYRLLPSFIECASASRRGRRKTRVLNFDTDNYPWMARIGYQERGGITFSCAGTIISKRYILTSAYCANKKSGALKEILLESAKHLSNPTELNYKYKVEKVIPHPEFDPLSRINDLALIRVNSDIQFNASSEIRPICLPFEDGYGIWDSMPKPGDLAYLGGWGFEQKNKTKKFQDLYESSVRIWPNENCTKAFEGDKDKVITPSQICAYASPSSNACRGDAGAPLMAVMTRHKIFFQIAVVSYGPQCGYRVPRVYTRISEYLRWILDTMEP